MYCILIVLILLALLLNNINKKQKTPVCKNTDAIKILARQCSRWAVAATQDKSPIIALLHANYAAGYLWALKDIATDIEIEEVLDADIKIFIKKIVDIQDASSKLVSSKCPEFLGDIDLELARLGGDL